MPTIKIYFDIVSPTLNDIANSYMNMINAEDYHITNNELEADVIVRFSNPLDLRIPSTGRPVLLYVSCPLGFKDALKFASRWSVDDLIELKQSNQIIPFGSSRYHVACLENTKVLLPHVERLPIQQRPRNLTFYYVVQPASVEMGMERGTVRPAMVPTDDDNLAGVLHAFSCLAQLDTRIKLIISSKSPSLERYMSKLVKKLIKNRFISKQQWLNFAKSHLELCSPDTDTHESILSKQASYLISPNVGTDLTSEILEAIRQNVPILLPESQISCDLIEVYGRHHFMLIPSMCVKNKVTNEPYILVENWSMINHILKIIMTNTQTTGYHQSTNCGIPELYDINNYIYYVYNMTT